MTNVSNVGLFPTFRSLLEERASRESIKLCFKCLGGKLQPMRLQVILLSPILFLSTLAFATDATISPGVYDKNTGAVLQARCLQWSDSDRVCDRVQFIKETNSGIVVLSDVVTSAEAGNISDRSGAPQIQANQVKLGDSLQITHNLWDSLAGIYAEAFLLFGEVLADTIVGVDALKKPSVPTQITNSNEEHYNQAVAKLPWKRKIYYGTLTSAIVITALAPLVADGIRDLNIECKNNAERLVAQRKNKHFVKQWLKAWVSLLSKTNHADAAVAIDSRIFQAMIDVISKQFPVTP